MRLARAEIGTREIAGGSDLDDQRIRHGALDDAAHPVPEDRVIIGDDDAIRHDLSVAGGMPIELPCGRLILASHAAVGSSTGVL